MGTVRLGLGPGPEDRPLDDSNEPHPPTEGGCRMKLSMRKVREALRQVNEVGLSYREVSLGVKRLSASSARW